MTYGASPLADSKVLYTRSSQSPADSERPAGARENFSRRNRGEGGGFLTEAGHVGALVL